MASSENLYDISPVIKLEPDLDMENDSSFGVMPSYPETSMAGVRAGFNLPDMELQKDTTLLNNEYSLYRNNDIISDEIYLPVSHLDPETVAMPVALVQNRLLAGTNDYELSQLNTSNNGMNGMADMNASERMNESSVSCPICGKCFKSHSGLNGHRQTHTPKFSPKRLMPQFASSHISNKSGEIVTVSPGFNCNLCGKGFMLEKNLRLHKAAKHKLKQSKTKFQKAKFAAEKLSSSNALSSSPSSITESQKYLRYQCPYCPQQISQFSNLRRHVARFHPLKLDRLISDLESQSLTESETIGASQSIDASDRPHDSPVKPISPSLKRRRDLSPQGKSQAAVSLLSTFSRPHYTPESLVRTAVSNCLASNSKKATASTTVKTEPTDSFNEGTFKNNRNSKINKSSKLLAAARPIRRVEEPELEPVMSATLPNGHHMKPSTGRNKRKLSGSSSSITDPSDQLKDSSDASSAIIRSTRIAYDQQGTQLPDSSAGGSVVEVIQELVTRVVIKFPDGSVRNEVYRRVL